MARIEHEIDNIIYGIENLRFTSKNNSENEEKILNRGTGAGGKNTNKNGLTFEEKTSILPILTEMGFEKVKIPNMSKIICYGKNISNTKFIYYASKKSFANLLCYVFQMSGDNLYKQPDEGFIIIENNTVIVKIMEKKNQAVEGSVFEKFYTAVYVRDICYKKHLPDIAKVEYAYCVNNWLKQKFNIDLPKYNDLMKFYHDNNIQVFYGDDNNYFQNVVEWLTLTSGSR